MDLSWGMDEEKHGIATKAAADFIAKYQSRDVEDQSWVLDKIVSFEDDLVREEYKMSEVLDAISNPVDEKEAKIVWDRYNQMEENLKEIREMASSLLGFTGMERFSLMHDLIEERRNTTSRPRLVSLNPVPGSSGNPTIFLRTELRKYNIFVSQIPTYLVDDEETRFWISVKFLGEISINEEFLDSFKSSVTVAPATEIRNLVNNGLPGASLEKVSSESISWIPVRDGMHLWRLDLSTFNQSKIDEQSFALAIHVAPGSGSSERVALNIELWADQYEAYVRRREEHARMVKEQARIFKEQETGNS